MVHNKESISMLLDVVTDARNTVLASKEQIENALSSSDWSSYDGGLFTRTDSLGGIFLMINGQLRHVPNPATYSNLFISSAKVATSDYVVDNAPRGPEITVGAFIAVGDGPAQFVITNNVKMWIPSPEVVNKFQFKGATKVAQILLDFITTGPNVG
jgi:hypothetical protein